MKLSPRQRQISVLKQRGATNKEIAIVLGVEESTIKSQYKLMRLKCKEHGVDIFAVPVNRAERMAFLRNLARVEYYKQRFGEECDNSSGIEGETIVSAKGTQNPWQAATNHRATCR